MRLRISSVVLLSVASWAIFSLSTVLAQEPEAWKQAQALFVKGNYGEAQEIFEKEKDQHPQAALGWARCLEARGKRLEAWVAARGAAEKFPKDAGLPAEMARLAFERGDFEQVEKAVELALKLDAESILARWVKAQWLRDTGKLAEAEALCQAIMLTYNRREQGNKPISDADDLRWVGQAAAEYATWKRDSEQFTFLVNDLREQQLQLNADYWPAHYEAGRLFQQKYNEADATRDFQQALKLNPRAAIVYVALGEVAAEKFELDQAAQLADRALKLNPELVQAYRLQADIHLANFNVEQARQLLEDKALPLNRQAEETLGRLAACYVVQDGLSPLDAQEKTRFGQLAASVHRRNAHAGVFYYELAKALDSRRRFNEALRFYQEAIERMPQLAGPRGQLGMLHMRLGEEEAGQKLLADSFEVDPFNVRVSNMLKVVEVLESYQTMRTEHFIIRYNEKKDKLLARYAAKYLEEQYPALCKQFGFEVPQPSLFEIFSQAKNTDGHGWFSARLIGLPYLGTVGACAGKMVGIASPNETPYHWARVLKHEFIHVINLQQTNYNLPHWLAEGIATYNEGYPRPETWDQLLIERTSKGTLFTLDNVNFGFIGPKSGLDWQMAYCQSELYVEYLFTTYGDQAIAKLLAAYADNLYTPAALERCFKITPEELDKGFLVFVKQLVEKLSSRREPAELDFAELERAQQADPKNADLLARLAYAYLTRRDFPTARKLAKEAQAQQAKHQLAAYVLARTYLVIGENELAVKLLEDNLDRDNPQENLLALLAAIKVKAKDFAAADELYGLGLKADPNHPRWVKGAAQVAVLNDNQPRATEMLMKLAEQDADNFTLRKKLAQLALAAKNYEQAVHWSREAIYVNVMDPEVHVWLAKAWLGAKNPLQAAEEWQVAVELKQTEAPLGLEIAQALSDADQKAAALDLLKQLQPLAPDLDGLKALQEKLSP